MPTLSLREFARRLGCDEKAIRKGIASGRLTAAAWGRDAQGKPVITDEDKARGEWARNAAKMRVATPSEATRLLALERARGLRLANDLKAGSLVRSVDIERRWARIVTEVRNALLGIPSRLKGRRPNLTSEDLRVIDELIRESLTELADRAGTRRGAVLEQGDDPSTQPHGPDPKE
jgi:phage terminase Nu1 subunit (DNA packaging protein)